MEWGQDQKGGRDMMRKLRDTRGETLVETLCAILIIALTFGFLTTATVSAARINAQVRARDVSFQYVQENAANHESAKVTLKRGTSSISSTDVDLYTSNGYHYYRAEGSTP